MRGRLGSKWKGMALALCVIILLTGCFGRRGVEYVGEHPELNSVALDSILCRMGHELGGLRAHQPSVDPAEQDDYGRIFFFYGEGSGIISWVIM